MALSYWPKAMMSGDCQSQGLAEWLRSLGWHENLQPSDLRKLNTPKMRSIWRHLQTQVVSPHVAATIRKNVLLSRLEEENIPVPQFRNFKLDSVSQLSKVKEIIKIEVEKNKVKEEIKKLDEKLQSERSSLLQKSSIVEWERHKLSDIESKTMVLELKHDKLLKDTEKINVDKETATFLKCSKTPISHSEQNCQKTIVCKYVKNYRYPFKEGDDDSEFLCEMLASISEFKPQCVLDGFVKIAKEALHLLNAEVNFTEGVEGKVSPKKIWTFEDKLRTLRVLMVTKELNVSKYKEKLESESNELKKEMAQLVGVLMDNDTKSKDCPGEKPDISESGALEEEALENPPNERMNNTDDAKKLNISKVLQVVLENIRQERKSKIIMEKKSRIFPENEIDRKEDLKQSVSRLSEEEDEIWKELENKTSEFNKLTSAICNGIVDSGEMNKLLAEILQLAANCKVGTSQLHKKDTDISEFTDIMLKEIEVFQGVPMVALQRKWDTSREMLWTCLTNKLSSNPTLLQFLLESEEKNLIVDVLGKCLWSLARNPTDELS